MTKRDEYAIDSSGGAYPDTPRRRFLRLCASMAAAISAHPALLAATGGERAYPRAALVDATGKPIIAEALEVGANYVFNYPYATTPCFLIDLGEPVEGGQRLSTESGRDYTWRGGAGPARSIVAFSAICAHRMTYPAQEVSFINYRHGPTDFLDADEEPAVRSQVIYCCSERSVYDARRGARVLGGPASQPLAAILLEYDSDTGGLAAVGAQGGTLFESFVKEFRHQLALEFGTERVDTLVSGQSTVRSLQDFTRNQILC